MNLPTEILALSPIDLLKYLVHFRSPTDQAFEMTKVISSYLKYHQTDDSGIDVGDTTSGNVHVSVFHGEHRASIIIDPDHATRVAERLWDCAATGRAVQMESKPQDSIP